MKKMGLAGMFALLLCITLYLPAYAAEIDNNRLPELNEEVESILGTITDSMSDVEKVLVVHEYFILNYSYGRNTHDFQFEAGQEYTAFGIMVNKIGVCEAYTQAFKYIMDKLEIPCINVTSTAMDHTWNMVSIDGQWYHVDVTGDDTAKNAGMHMSFLRSDEGITETGHYGWDGTVSATSKKYDNAFWINTLSYIQHIDGSWYYVDSGNAPGEYKDGFMIHNSDAVSAQGYIKKYNFTKDTHETIHTVPSQTYTYKVRDTPRETTWKGGRTAIGVDDGKIYFNTNNQVFSIKPDGTDKTLICTVTLADYPLSSTTGVAFMENMEIKNGTIYYRNSEDGETYVATALPTAVPEFTITTGGGTGGRISPSGYIRVTRNRSRTFMITPDNGCVIDDVLVDGVSVGAVSEYTFKNVKANHKIEAIFSTAGGEWQTITLGVEYDSIDSFSEGLAAITKDGKYGYINASGKLVIPLSGDYERSYGFQNGLAQVYKSGGTGLINTSGALVVPCIYDFIGPFSDGLAPIGKDGQCGFINELGELAIDLMYDNHRSFINGVAWVFRDGRSFYINTSGDEVEYKEEDSTPETRLEPFYQNGKYGYVLYHMKGMFITSETAIPNIFENAMYFSEGLACVYQDGKAGYINTQGELVIPYGFDHGGYFSDGLAYVLQNGRYGFIDASGEMVVPCIYEGVSNFNEGLAPVRRDDGWVLLKRRTLGGNDSSNMSSWATAEVNSALDLNLIPYDLQNSYTSNISRAEFCKLVINLLRIKTGKPVKTILTQKGVTLNYNAFSDTADVNILAANALGIVNGVGGNRFNPSGSITRQEAAAMLQRAAKVLGVTKPNGQTTHYNDASDFASWAADPIAFVSALADKKTNKSVMSGTGSNRFTPMDTYTREQSYLTIFRLYNAL